MARHTSNSPAAAPTAAQATLLFPRTGQRLRVSVPTDQREAVARRNRELILHFSPNNSNDPAVPHPPGKAT